MNRKKAIIIGATSGIGLEIAIQLLQEGWKIGATGRRSVALLKLQHQFEGQVEIEVMDVTLPKAPEQMNRLIERLGGMDLFLLSAGIGFQNPELNESIEVDTMMTNGVGFTRMIGAAFNYFKTHGKAGQIAAITSVAGTKGIGVAPAYSASKRFQQNYIEAMAQLAYRQGLDINFTDIRPGFVATDLLKGRDYPLLMDARFVAGKIIDAIKRKQRIVVIDWRYRMLVILWRFIPRWIWERMKVG